jgi:hypothetical protein
MKNTVGERRPTMLGKHSRPVVTTATVLAMAITTWLIVFLAIKAWTRRITPTTVAPCTEPGCQLGSFADFRDATWRPVTYFLSGRDPYDSAAYLAEFPYSQDYPTYAPGHLLAWLPVGSLDWDAAVVADLLINIVVITAVGAWAGVTCLRAWWRPAYGPSPSRTLLTLAATCGVFILWFSRVVSVAAHWGQPSVVYTLLAVPAVLTRNRWVAVVFTALTCMKPQVGVVVVLILLAQKRWRTAGLGVGLAAVLSMTAVLILTGGPSGVAGWLATLRGNIAAASDRRSREWLGERVDIVGALQDVGVRVGDMESAAISILGFALAYAAARWAVRRDLPYTAAVMGFGIGLVCIYHLSYDAAWLVVPVLFAAAELHRRSRRIFVVTVPALAMLLLAPLASRYHAVDEVFGTGASILLIRVLMMVGLVGLAVGLLLTRHTATPDVPQNAADDDAAVAGASNPPVHQPDQSALFHAGLRTAAN